MRNIPARIIPLSLSWRSGIGVRPNGNSGYRSGFGACLVGFFFILLTLVSCDNNESAEHYEANNVLISFKIVLNDASEGTRTNTDWSDYDPKDNGTEYENRINPDDVQIAFYDADNSLLGVAVNLSVTEVSSESTQETKTYEVLGTVPMANTGLVGKEITNCKVMLFVNCNKTENDINGKNADDESIKNIPFTMAQAERNIPMWGVKTISNLFLKPGERTELGNMDLLRAVAKAEVTLQQSLIDEGYKIVGLNYHSRQTEYGYCLPGDNYLNVAETKELAYTESFYPYNPNTDFSSIQATVAAEGKSAILYMPEYDNATDKVYLELVVQKGSEAEETYNIEFKQYADDGTPKQGTDYDIVRNHYYKFCVFKKSGANIMITLNVRKWAVYTNAEIIM